MAQKAFEKLATMDGGDVVIGILSDAEAPETAAQASQHSIPLIITGTQIQSVTGSQCNRFTFRLCPSSFQSARLGALLAGRSGAKKWTTAGLDDAASQELWEQFVTSLKQVMPKASFAAKGELGLMGDKRVDSEQAVNKIVASGADGVYQCAFKNVILIRVESRFMLSLPTV